MAFHFGQKVECFRYALESHPGIAPADWPDHIKLGGTYTIRDVDARAGILAVRLQEHYCEPFMTSVGMWETAFPAYCFRPITERKTDISIFTAMLKPAPKTKVTA